MPALTPGDDVHYGLLARATRFVEYRTVGLEDGVERWVAVKGKAFYGTPPPVSNTNTAAPDDQWHVGQGRLLPSTAVDQYAATLARWFGVEDNELAGILPNLRNFTEANGYPPDLGFMAT